MSNLVALPAGTELAGDFRVKRVLGAGGFGITYLADELALGRQVTIKEYFPTDYAARKTDLSAFPRSRETAEDYKWGLDRFIDEAKALARFDHPNIVRVYRYFRENNTGYMVLQFEEGGSFKAWLRGLGRVPRQAELDALLGPLLDALALIHAGDFLHRDIAPDNIIVRKDKSPVLIDFGSARGDIASQSRTVSALVKPGYSPYEQYASNTRQQGPWTDIYALAATFYQAITGRRPPDAPSRMVKDEYVSAREAAVGGFRAGFLAAIDKALKLEIGERPQSIADWRDAIFAPDPKAAPKRPSKAKIGEVLGLKREPPAVSPTLAAAKPTVVLAEPAAAAPPAQFYDYVQTLRQPGHAGGGAGKANNKPDPVQPEARAIAVAEPQDNAATPRFGLGYGAAPKTAPSPSPSSMAEPAAAPPAAVVPPVPAVIPAVQQRVQSIERRRPRRRQAWFFFRQPWRGLILKFGTGLAVASLLTIYQDRLVGLMPGLTPTKGHVSSTQSSSPQRAEQALQKAEPTLLPAPQQLSGPTGSVTAIRYIGESGRVVTLSTDATLRVWDASSGTMLKSIPLSNGAATAIAAEGNEALTGHADGTLCLWNLDNGERLAIFRRDGGALTAVAFAPETGRYVAASQNGSLSVWDRKTTQAPMQVVDQAGGEGGPVTALVRVAANDAIAYPLADGTVRLTSSEGLTQIRNYHGTTGTVTALDSPESGGALASAAADGSIHVWSTRSSRLIKKFRAHDGAVMALSYAPSGEVLATTGADGMLKLWDARRGRLLAATAHGGQKVQSIAVAADGRHLAVASMDGSVRLWDASAIKLARE